MITCRGKPNRLSMMHFKCHKCGKEELLSVVHQLMALCRLVPSPPSVKSPTAVVCTVTGIFFFFELRRAPKGHALARCCKHMLLLHGWAETTLRISCQILDLILDWCVG